MNRIRKMAVEAYRFLNSQRTSKYVVNMIFCFIVLLLFELFNNQIFGDVISVFLGFLISNIVVGFVQVLFRSFEDNAKVTDDTEMLIKLYKHDLLEKKISMNGTSASVAYKPVYIHEGAKLSVEDAPDKMFEPDDFICDNFETLFGAHRMSAKKNFDTVRLDDFKVENGEAKFFVSRSNYYYHLVTNRAIDYRLDDDLSLRTYYEYGPSLKSLAQSNMSNHIGVNALVYLKDGELLLPRRNGSSTISKNLVTSSIAIMLMLPQCNNITAEYLFKGAILEGLVSRTKMNEQWIKEDEIDIKFLGFGQNPYEGGKPQFYYSVHMKNVGRKEYISNLISEHKDSLSVIDVDRNIYVAKTEDMKFDKNGYLVVPYYHGSLKNGNYSEKQRKCVVGYEKSFLANLWHDEGYKMEDGAASQEKECVKTP